MVQQANIADVPITLGSLDPCFSCTERLETVDRRTHEVRVYSRAELLEMSRRRVSAGL
jgi:Ni,Fe-hydrogenase III large subunit